MLARLKAPHTHSSCAIDLWYSILLATLTLAVTSFLFPLLLHVCACVLVHAFFLPSFRLHFKWLFGLCTAIVFFFLPHLAKTHLSFKIFPFHRHIRECAHLYTTKWSNFTCYIQQYILNVLCAVPLIQFIHFHFISIIGNAARRNDEWKSLKSLYYNFGVGVLQFVCVSYGGYFHVVEKLHNAENWSRILSTLWHWIHSDVDWQFTFQSIDKNDNDFWASVRKLVYIRFRLFSLFFLSNFFCIVQASVVYIRLGSN